MNRLPQKKDTDSKESIEKMFDIIYHSLENQIKKSNITTHQLKWIKSKIVTTPNVGKDTEQTGTHIHQ